MAPFSVIRFFKDQFATLPTVEPMDLSGRTVLVVGSSAGLGLEAAKHFASMKPTKLIHAVRNIQKGEEVKKSIAQLAPETAQEVWQLDLASLSSVKAFVTRAEKELDRLDILLLNAGVAYSAWTTTTDGYEVTLQTNVISTGLCAVLLLPLVEKTANLPVPPKSSHLKPHITLTGSEVHFMTQYKESSDAHPIVALNDQNRFDAGDRYNVSKLLNLFIVREIGRLASDDIIVNVVNPGLCWSALDTNSGLVQRFALLVMRTLLARTTEAGSRTLVWAATHDTPKGAYSSKCQVEEESDFSLSEAGKEAQRKSWADLSDIYIKTEPRAQAILSR